MRNYYELLHLSRDIFLKYRVNDLSCSRYKRAHDDHDDDHDLLIMMRPVRSQKDKFRQIRVLIFNSH